MFAVLLDDKFDLPLHKSCSKQQIAFRGADMVCKYTQYAPCQQFCPPLSRDFFFGIYFTDSFIESHVVRMFISIFSSFELIFLRFFSLIYIAFHETKNSSGSPLIVLLFLGCNVLHGLHLFGLQTWLHTYAVKTLCGQNTRSLLPVCFTPTFLPLTKC